ncbi:MAG: type I 3-dehydroquinate dehydratase [Thermoanaerobaculaceae bacterium]|jgi:3-dehydroquinate dehydratase/shikimate dehydrogenase|nr:type I 3-dehydroquinate dehydratase [Thermoanaerobaculaceae bacterium]
MEIVATYVPRPGADPEAMRAELRRPPQGATAVELRADLLPEGVSPESLFGVSTLPVVVTLRSREEGGQGPDDPGARRRFYERALALPALAFDLEAARDLDLVDRVVPRERVILSAHPASVPTDLVELGRKLLGRGTLLVKLAPAVSTLDDLLAVLSAARALNDRPRKERRAVVLAIGEAGRAARLLGPLLGSPLAYVAWDADRTAAPGQYTADELLALTGHLAGPPRRLFAVLGTPVGGSLSPRMHNAAYRAAGLHDLFVPIEVQDPSGLGRLLQPAGVTALDELGLRAGGFAVTMPWKEEAMRCCTTLAPRAARARAVNTALPRPGMVLGDCTDIDGVVRALAAAGVELDGARAVVLGAGGSARAAVVALQGAGCEVAVAARDPEKAAALARELDSVAISPQDAGRCGVAVNATPAGADGSLSPWMEGLRLASRAVVLDLPYGPGPTFLQLLAESRHWSYVGGREVLLWQGVAQYAAMTLSMPPVPAMAAALGLAVEEEA